MKPESSDFKMFIKSSLFHVRPTLMDLFSGTEQICNQDT